MSETEDLVIGFDIGGTKVAAVVIDGEGTVVARNRASTPLDDGSRLVEVLVSLIKSFQARYPSIRAVGVGCAGLVEYPGGVVLVSPNAGYEGFALKDLLNSSTGLPVVVENDVNAAVLAESRLGAGRGYRVVVGISPGTGIGGGVCIDGELFRGATGLAPEPGHMVVDPQGPICPCGNRGCLEARVSGKALGRSGREAAEGGKGIRLVELAGGSIDNITGEIVAEAAAEGDPDALKIFDEMGYWLGIGMANLVNLFDPHMTVVGGGVAEVGPLLLDRIHPSYEDHIFGVKKRKLPPVVPALLGNEAAAIGAAIAVQV